EAKSCIAWIRSPGRGRLPIGSVGIGMGQAWSNAREESSAPPLFITPKRLPSNLAMGRGPPRFHARTRDSGDGGRPVREPVRPAHRRFLGGSILGRSSRPKGSFAGSAKQACGLLQSPGAVPGIGGEAGGSRLRMTAASSGLLDANRVEQVGSMTFKLVSLMSLVLLVSLASVAFVMNSYQIEGMGEGKRTVSAGGGGTPQAFQLWVGGTG